MLAILRKIWVLLFPPKIEELEHIPLPEKPMETNEEKLIKTAVSYLDLDVTPQDNIPDEVACSEVICTIIKEVLPNFPILGSTADLFKELKTDKRFKATLNTHRGVIVVSPRTTETYGHTGIFITDEKIASNNSSGALKGKFTGNYTWNSWIAEFIHNRGLRSILFEMI